MNAMPKKIKRISKSQYLKGLQCPKALWLFWHRKDLKPDIDERQQYLFDVGHDVGRLATKLFDNGIEISEEYYQIDKAINTTQHAIQSGKNTLFEATACSDDGAYSRIDILDKAGASDAWNLIEVKSSTSVNDYYFDDIAFQRYAFINSGYKIHQSILIHLNNVYVRMGPIDIKKLFILEDCTDIVEMKIGKIKEHVRYLIDAANHTQEPTVDIGPRCKTPFECDYMNYCWQHIPDYSVYNIFKGSKLSTLLEKNIINIEDIPEYFEATDRQAIEINSFKNKITHIDKIKLEKFINKLTYPLYFLDYETINPALPIFNNSSPYQPIPFQFSLHVQEKKGGKIKHEQFLHTGDDDPRPYLLNALVQSCGKNGSVIVYNQAFEQYVNENLAKMFSKYQSALEIINRRMIDLMEPFKKRYIYHPDMKGSASLKNVLPAFISDLTYDKLAIDDGMTASLQYLKCIQNKVSAKEKESIYKHLKEYCATDTLAEVKLVEHLYRAIN